MAFDAMDILSRRGDVKARLTKWVQGAAPGESIEYYRGNLAHDRCLGDVAVAAPASNAGNAAMSLYMAGLVDLVQSRVADGVCAYIAIKRRGVRR